MNEWMNDIYFDEKYVMKTGILAKKRLLSKTYHMRSSRRVRSDEQPPPCANARKRIPRTRRDGHTADVRP